MSASLKLTGDYNEIGRLANVCHAVGCANFFLPWTLFMYARQTRSAKSAGKQRVKVAEEHQTAPPKKRGRPVGSKDKQPRQQKAIKIAWDYGGKKGARGMQFGAIGQACKHDPFGEGFVVQQLNASSLVLQFGEGGDVTLSTVDAKDVQGITAATVIEGVAGSSSATAPATPAQAHGKRRSGLTYKKRTATNAPASGIQKRATKAQVMEAKKRKKREATAVAPGKPVKPGRQKQNKSWDPALKQQAVDMYHSKYASSRNFEGCAKELSCLPSFEGVNRANVRGWVSAAAKLAAQEPNEYGLVVYQQGRPPALPEGMYNELKE